MSIRDDRECRKREQIGRKLERCISIDLYFLIVERVVVLSVRGDLTDQCGDWLWELLLGKGKGKLSRSRKYFLLSLL